MKQYISIKKESPFILGFTKRRYINIGIIVLLTFVLSGCFHSADTPLRPSAKFDWQLDSTCSRTVSLDIPAGYNEGAVADAIERKIFPKRRPKDSCKQSEILLLNTLWPEMAPRTLENNDEFNVLGGGRELSIMITSGAIDAKVHGQNRLHMSLNSTISVFLSRVCVPRFQLNNTCYDLKKISVKPGRFGLKRTGVDFSQFPKLDKNAYHHYMDIYYPSEFGDKTKSFIRCEPLEAPLVVYGMKRFPSCSQFFIFEPMNALVKVRYQRHYLKDWNLIQLAMEKLLHSFIVEQ